MLDSPLIEVAIGLSFVFLLVSLLVSSVCEMLSGFFRWRAQYLWAGLETLLQSPDARARLYGHPLVKGLAPMKVMTLPIAGRLAHLRYRIGLRFGDGPSYIPSRTFALALIDVIREPHAVAGALEARLNGLIELGASNPTALAQALTQLVQQAEQDPSLAAGAVRLRDLQARLFQAVDPSVLGALTWQVENVLASVPTSGQGSLGPVTEWLAQAARAHHYIELRAALADAITAMPVTQPAARECRTTLDGVLARFTLGSPAEITRELQQFVDSSKQVHHALANAGDQFKGLAGSLAPLLDDAAGDVERFRENVEMWFNDGMDRVSGAYKRHTMAWQAVIGLLLAVLMNVDAVQITRTLWHDSAVRQVIVAQAEGVAARDQAPAGGAGEFSALTTQVSSLGLPVGWRGCEAPAAGTAVSAVSESASLGTPLLWCAEGGWNWLGLLPMLLGWCLTAAAVSLGAPFWFDTLKRFISIRSSGKAPEERPTPPKEVPQPRQPGERQ